MRRRLDENCSWIPVRLQSALQVHSRLSSIQSRKASACSHQQTGVFYCSRASVLFTVINNGSGLSHQVFSISGISPVDTLASFFDHSSQILTICVYLQKVYFIIIISVKNAKIRYFNSLLFSRTHYFYPS